MQGPTSDKRSSLEAQENSGWFWFSDTKHKSPKQASDFAIQDFQLSPLGLLSPAGKRHRFVCRPVTPETHVPRRREAPVNPASAPRTHRESAPKGTPPTFTREGDGSPREQGRDDAEAGAAELGRNPRRQQLGGGRFPGSGAWAGPGARRGRRSGPRGSRGGGAPARPARRRQKPRAAEARPPSGCPLLRAPHPCSPRAAAARQARRTRRRRRWRRGASFVSGLPSRARSARSPSAPRTPARAGRGRGLRRLPAACLLCTLLPPLRAQRSPCCRSPPAARDPLLRAHGPGLALGVRPGGDFPVRRRSGHLGP